MKLSLLALACLSALSLAALAEDNETQTIRQALMKDSELSTTAKNIKIITANGQVTLRGPVKTAQEKARIDQLAKSAAGSARIDDQLDVKGSN